MSGVVGPQRSVPLYLVGWPWHCRGWLLAVAVQLVRDNPAHPLRIDELAEGAGTDVGKLRRFVCTGVR